MLDRLLTGVCNAMARPNLHLQAPAMEVHGIRAMFGEAYPVFLTSA